MIENDIRQSVIHTRSTRRATGAPRERSCQYGRELIAGAVLIACETYVVQIRCGKTLRGRFKCRNIKKDLSIFIYT